MFQTSFWTCSLQAVQESEIIWISKWLPLILSSHSLITILNKQEFIIYNNVTRPVQYSLSKLPTMATIYDKPGAGWDKNDPDNYFTSYFKTNEMGDVVQQEKNLQHHISWKRITLLWRQWGILKLFAPNQTKGNLLFNVWWMCMKRAMPPIKQGIRDYSKMKLTSLRQVKTCWCACPLTSLMD